MRRWLRRRRLWFIGAGSGLPSAWRWALTVLALLTVTALAITIYIKNQALEGLQSKTLVAYGQLQEDHKSLRAEATALRNENTALRQAVNKQRDAVISAQAISNTVETETIADKAVQTELINQIRLLQQENQKLKSDLGFFESVVPKAKANGSAGLKIRSLRAQRLDPKQVRWRILVVQAVKNPPAFEGQVELTLSGTLDGKPWTQSPPNGPTALSLIQYVRLEGVINVPDAVELKTLSAKLVKNKKVLTVETFKF
jgi:hypothetical protein